MESGQSGRHGAHGSRGHHVEHHRQDPEHDDDQRTRNFRGPSAQEYEQADGGEADAHGGEVHGIHMLSRPLEEHVELGGPGAGNAQQVGQLVQPDDEGGCTGESADDRPGQEVGQEAHSKRAEEPLNQAHHQGEEQGEFDVAVGAHHGHSSQACSHQQGVHRHRSDGQGARRAHQRVDHLGNEGRIEAVDHRKSGDEGVRHPLGHQHDPDREAGRQVACQVLPGVGG